MRFGERSADDIKSRHSTEWRRLPVGITLRWPLLRLTARRENLPAGGPPHRSPIETVSGFEMVSTSSRVRARHRELNLYVFALHTAPFFFNG